MKLYHGTSLYRLESILREGLEAPSYWGTLEEAMRYADGLLFCLDADRFSEGLEPNDLLAGSLAESGDEEALADWEASGRTWEDSLSIFGSVRCDTRVAVSMEDIAEIPQAPHP